MRKPWCCIIFAVFLVADALCVGVNAAAASAFDPAQVIQLLKREIAAVESFSDSSSPSLRVEDAVLDLDLVEVGGKSGSRLLVPGADFGAGKDEPAKPALRRRMLVDLARAGEIKSMETTRGEAGAPVAAGALARVLADLRSAFLPTVDAPQTWDFKRLGVDLDFALEREGKGAPMLVVFAAGRAIDAKNVQKLKLRLGSR